MGQPENFVRRASVRSVGIWSRTRNQKTDPKTILGRPKYKQKSCFWPVKLFGENHEGLWALESAPEIKTLRPRRSWGVLSVDPKIVSFSQTCWGASHQDGLCTLERVLGIKNVDPRTIPGQAVKFRPDQKKRVQTNSGSVLYILDKC